ncbi:MAG: hypothetical protein WC735_01765 [Candidatus Paceibacterota bacterium]|jgi:hypothetical protein
MNEGMNIGGSPSPEQLKRLEKERQGKEDAERLADYLARHPEPVISPENLRDCAQEVTNFEFLVGIFESRFSLAELNSIIDLTPADAPKHPVREPARLALIPIVEKLNALKKETNISPEKFEELKAKYKIISRAVGIINKNKVDHDR